MENVDTASSIAAKASAIAATTVAPTQQQPQNLPQLQQHSDDGESRVLGPAQPLQAVREKRSAPSTPPRVHGERMQAEDSGSPESVVPQPKRAHSASSSLVPVCVEEDTLATNELNRIPYQQTTVESDESDSEDLFENFMTDLISESDRPIYAALKAASLGDLSARSFLMDKYARDELSPPMRAMMDNMTENG